MSNTAWLMVGLLVTAVFIGGYAAYLSARIKRLRARLSELDRRS